MSAITMMVVVAVLTVRLSLSACVSQSSLVYHFVHRCIHGYTESSTPFHESDAVPFSAKTFLPMVVGFVVVVIYYPQW